MALSRMMTAVASACTAAALIAFTPAPAQADVGGESGGDSFNVSLSVEVRGGTGDPVSSGPISITVRAPRKCWWVAFDTANFSFYDINPQAPDAMSQYFKAMREDTTITFVPATLGWPRQDYLDAHRGETWYTLKSAPGVNCADEGYTRSGGRGPEGWAPGSGNIPIGYAAFPAGEPQPLVDVDVDDVVEEVWDAASAEIDGPDLGRNPEITDAGAATLVNWVNWFWVQNVQEALAGDGEIHLKVEIPAYPEVFATLDAATDGVQITSAAGATACSIAEATTEYSSGVSEASACTLAFDRANRDGWTVTGQTTWTGTWQGQDADGQAGGTLQALTPSASIDVPVLESQTLVTDVD